MAGDRPANYCCLHLSSLGTLGYFFVTFEITKIRIMELRNKYNGLETNSNPFSPIYFTTTRSSDRYFVIRKTFKYSFYLKLQYFLLHYEVRNVGWSLIVGGRSPCKLLLLTPLFSRNIRIFFCYI